MVRSPVLFAHIVGMLTLFAGLGLEWLSVEPLGRSTASREQSRFARVSAALPRVYGLAFGLILICGISLAARTGAFDLGWVRVSFAAMLLMGLLGAPKVQSRMHGIGLPHASLPIRVAVALATVYLMISKPDVGESSLVIGAAVAVAAVFSMLQRRPLSSAAGG